MMPRNPQPARVCPHGRACHEDDYCECFPSPSPATLDREAVARIIDPSSWRVLDGYLADVKRKYKGKNAGYDPEAFRDKASLAKADAILALIPTPPEAVAELVAAAENAKLILNDYVADAEDSTVAQAIDRLAKAVRAVKGEGL